jgi:hypothetical protein
MQDKISAQLFEKTIKTPLSVCIMIGEKVWKGKVCYSVIGASVCQSVRQAWLAIVYQLSIR